MLFVKYPNQLGKEDVKEAGGKGANLAELTNAGFPVPECFFITVNAYERFIDENNLREKVLETINGTDFSNFDSLKDTSEKIKAMVIGAKMPPSVRDEIKKAYEGLGNDVGIRSIDFLNIDEKPFVAVRSSAVTEDVKGASSAGQQETFLNIKGLDSVALAVQKCWASLFTERAIYYRHKHSLPQEAGISVIIQRMVNSEKSGVMFSINPVTSENNITVEAVWGLGETIVQGEVTPDTYIVDKSSGAILDRKIGNKLIERVRGQDGKTIKRNVNQERINAQVLTDAEVVKIAAYGKKIEQHYGFPQDIEYAIERGKIYIVQSRAVTFFADNKDGNKIDNKNSGTHEDANREANQIAHNANQVLLRGMGVSPGVGSGIVKIVTGLGDINKIEKGDVLVTEMTNPDFVPAMEKAAAIVTNRGGVTSHAAIVSRELGVPAVVGTVNATEVLKDGQIVTVDATNGIVYDGAIALSASEKANNIENNLSVNPSSVSAMETQSLLTATQVKVNLAFPQHLEELAKKADGVGLMRLEHVMTEAGTHPFQYIRDGKSEELTRILVEKIGTIAKAFFPKPVWVRTLDVRTDEFRHMKGGENEKKEDNPMLGWHGIRRDLDEVEIFKAQLSAFKKLHEDGLTNVKVMLPFVISVDELKKAKQIAKEFGMPDSFKFGIMCETPACALTMEEFCKEGIDFVSFGSNDLTQTTLAVDRNNESLAKIFNSFHPAVLRLFREVIKICRKYGVESSICGEEGSNPKMAEILVGYGIDSLSANIDAVDKIRQTAALAERKLILDGIRRAKNG
ncbi:MAG: phosphoenolpyruvate synthase [Candidatus Aenigmatarchaeota archaeon]